MQSNYSNNAGISKKYREILDLLNREFQAPFTAKEAIEKMQIDSVKGFRLLAHLASKGWLTRIRKGIYITVPLGSLDPKKQTENAWVIANKLFDPCYIGGWSATEYWHLTEQIFNDVVVFTTKNIRESSQLIKSIRFKTKSIQRKYLFGTSNVWLGGEKVCVSDPTKTIIDMLNDPSIGGGIRHITNILINYFESEHKDIAKIEKYLKKMGNKTIYKRLGYLLEVLNVDEKNLINKCSKNISRGYTDLDPTVKTEGKIISRWNLKINVNINREEY